MPARYIARSSGDSAVRSAAYSARDAITAERTGQLHYFKHRDACWHCLSTKDISIGPFRFRQALLVVKGPRCPVPTENLIRAGTGAAMR